jgi:hypothetical protein
MEEMGRGGGVRKTQNTTQGAGHGAGVGSLPKAHLQPKTMRRCQAAQAARVPSVQCGRVEGTHQ